VKVRRHYAEVDGAYATVGMRPAVQAEGNLREAASRQGALVIDTALEEKTEEKPRQGST
jgi:hypothetical protein